MFDLHCHSKASDGLATFETVVRRFAERPDLELIALTDHDAITWSVRFAAIDARAWVGTEMTTKHGSRTVDLLALNVRADHAEFNAYLVSRRAERIARFDAFGPPLRALGWLFDPPACVYDEPQIAKPHVVRELRRHPQNLARFADMGIPLEVSHRFDDDLVYKLILNGLSVPTASVLLSTVETIALVHRAGGIAVIAHPWLSPYDEGHATKTKARRSIAEWAAAGLDGLEVFHERQTDPAVRDEIMAQAKMHGLLVTAGCDDHSADLRFVGALSPAESVGRPWLAAIRERAALRRRQASA